MEGVLPVALDTFPIVLGDCPPVFEQLVRMRLTDPTPDEILTAAEIVADQVSIPALVRATSPIQRSIIEGGLQTARRYLRSHPTSFKELLQKISQDYPDWDMRVKRYPKLTKKLFVFILTGQ